MTTPPFDASRYQFLADALDGNGGFRPCVAINSANNPVSLDASYLIRHPREGTDKYARRNQVAWYVNDLKSACSRFVGYLSKRPPSREIKHPLLDKMAQDCNWRGDSLDVFLSSFMVQAKARGAMLLLVDMPSAMPASRLDQVKQRAFPYLVPLFPEDIHDYRMNPRGQLTWVTMQITHEDSKAALKTWTESGWAITRDGATLAAGEYSIGRCPVLVFSEDGSFPCYGEFAQMADVSRRLFNLRSELDEILRGQTFSVMTMQVTEGQTPEELSGAIAQIGTNNMLVHTGITPSFIAPPDGPAEMYRSTIADLQGAQNRIGHVVDAPDNAESGIALTLRFQALNGSLTMFARRIEDLERQVWDVASLWLKIENRTETSWAKDYALADIGAELANLQLMTDAGFPAAALAEKKKAIAMLEFATLEADRLQEIFSAIDEEGAELVPGEVDSTTLDVSAVDLTPIESRLDSIDAKLNEPAELPDFRAIESRLAGIEGRLNQPAQQPAAPPTLVVNNGSGAKIIDLQRDADGNITGAAVRESAA